MWVIYFPTKTGSTRGKLKRVMLGGTNARTSLRAVKTYNEGPGLQPPTAHSGFGYAKRSAHRRMRSITGPTGQLSMPAIAIDEKGGEQARRVKKSLGASRRGKKPRQRKNPKKKSSIPEVGGKSEGELQGRETAKTEQRAQQKR